MNNAETEQKMKWRTKEKRNGGEKIGSILKVHFQEYVGEKGQTFPAYLFNNDKCSAAGLQPRTYRLAG